MSRNQFLISNQIMQQNLVIRISRHGRGTIGINESVRTRRLGSQRVYFEVGMRQQSERNVDYYKKMGCVLEDIQV